jgi:hypothetical protein
MWADKRRVLHCAASMAGVAAAHPSKIGPALAPDFQPSLGRRRLGWGRLPRPAAHAGRREPISLQLGWTPPPIPSSRPTLPHASHAMPPLPLPCSPLALCLQSSSRQWKMSRAPMLCPTSVTGRSPCPPHISTCASSLPAFMLRDVLTAHAFCINSPLAVSSSSAGASADSRPAGW